MGKRRGGAGILAPIFIGLGACTTYGSIHPFVEGRGVGAPPELLGSWQSVVPADSSTDGETPTCFHLAEVDSTYRLRIWNCLRGESGEYDVVFGRVGDALVADVQPRPGDDLGHSAEILRLHSLYRIRLAAGRLFARDLDADSLGSLVDRDARFGQRLGDTPGPDVLLIAPTAVLRELLASPTAGPGYFTGPGMTFVRVGGPPDP